MIETFDALAALIRRRSTPVAPRLIAIDGPSGAGKSTFAHRLGRSLGGPPVIEMDDFVSWGNLDGWWSRLEAQVLRPIVAGQPALYQQRDWDSDPHSDLLGGWRTVSASDIVILEGVTSSRREVTDRLTYAVWADAPQELRLQRGVDRDGEEMRSAWLDWMQREDAFFAADGTRERAHLVVDGAPAAPHDPEHQFVGQPNPALITAPDLLSKAARRRHLFDPP